MTTPKYKRILLKLSGEALMGPDAYGINPQTISGIVAEVKEVADLGVEIAVVVALAMTTIVIVSSVLGVILPLVLQRLRVDPAVASNPLIASVMDILGLLIYFAVVKAVL